MRQLEDSLLDGVALQHFVGCFKSILDQRVLFGHHAHFSDHIDLAVQTAMHFGEFLVLIFGEVELIAFLDWLQLDAQPFLLEPHPVLLVPVYRYYYFLENLLVPPAEVALEEGVAVGVVPVKFHLFFRQLHYPRRLFQLY